MRRFVSMVLGSMAGSGYMKLVRMVGVFLICLIVSPFQLSAAEEKLKANLGMIENPGSELWRNVRQRDLVIEGISQVKSPGANVLINVSGEGWRQYRMNKLIPTAGLAILIAFLNKDTC